MSTWFRSLAFSRCHRGSPVDELVPGGASDVVALVASAAIVCTPAPIGNDILNHVEFSGVTERRP